VEAGGERGAKGEEAEEEKEKEGGQFRGRRKTEANREQKGAEVAGCKTLKAKVQRRERERERPSDRERERGRDDSGNLLEWLYAFSWTIRYE